MFRYQPTVLRSVGKELQTQYDPCDPRCTTCEMRPDKHKWNESLASLRFLFHFALWTPCCATERFAVRFHIKQKKREIVVILRCRRRRWTTTKKETAYAIQTTLANDNRKKSTAQKVVHDTDRRHLRRNESTASKSGIFFFRFLFSRRYTRFQKCPVPNTRVIKAAQVRCRIFEWRLFPMIREG